MRRRHDRIASLRYWPKPCDGGRASVGRWHSLPWSAVEVPDQQSGHPRGEDGPSRRRPQRAQSIARTASVPRPRLARYPAAIRSYHRAGRLLVGRHLTRRELCAACDHHRHWIRPQSPPPGVTSCPAAGFSRQRSALSVTERPAQTLCALPMKFDEVPRIITPPGAQRTDPHEGKASRHSERIRERRMQ